MSSTARCNSPWCSGPSRVRGCPAAWDPQASLDSRGTGQAWWLGQSQEEFALMIGVSVATLRNWEQGRRTPEVPALALLRVAARNPKAVAEALHSPSKRGAA